MKQQILLGRGILGWFRDERISDRYGSVHLEANSDLEEFCNGQRGRLSALILETKESSHCGDLFRGIYPSTPKIGEEIILGEGELFYFVNYGVKAVGVIPDDKRESDWLNPINLYRCHDQTVELRFELFDSKVAG